MSYIQPKVDYKDGDVLHGIDLNASNEVIKAGVDDNFDRIQGLETEKQNVIDSSNKLDYSLLDNPPYIPTKVSDLTNDTGFITSDYHDSIKQDVLTAGEGISIAGNVISNTQTSAEWGNIQGDIEDQTDLMSTLANKQDKIDSNNKLDYNLLDNTPTIPSKTSDLTNDSGFIDNTYHDSTKQDVLVSGTNIKTINNQNILGSGNINIGGGSGGTSDYDQLENRPQINNVTLSGNKSLSDLGITIPTKLSDLTNDNNTVTDANYVHTDNNYTAAEKTKLSGVETGAEVNEIDTIKVNNVAQTVSSKEVNITVPTNLSDLTNDNNTVTDANYVHTDNNYTSAEKTKLAGIEAGSKNNVIILNCVSSIAPVDFEFADLYYNTTTNKFYRANIVGYSLEWVEETSMQVQSEVIYVAKDTQTSYIYNGTTLICIGDSEIAIGSEQATEDTKLIIEESDLDFQGLEIANEYNTANNMAYSCEYINDSNSYSTSEVKTNKRWIDGKPIYRKVLNGSISNTTTVLSGVDTLVYFGGSATVFNTRRTLPYYEIYNNLSYGFTIQSQTNTNTWQTVIYAQGNGATASNCNIVLEYTKTTD